MIENILSYYADRGKKNFKRKNEIDILFLFNKTN